MMLRVSRMMFKPTLKVGNYKLIELDNIIIPQILNTFYPIILFKMLAFPFWSKLETFNS